MIVAYVPRSRVLLCEFVVSSTLLYCSGCGHVERVSIWHTVAHTVAKIILCTGTCAVHVLSTCDSLVETQTSVPRHNLIRRQLSEVVQVDLLVVVT